MANCHITRKAGALSFNVMTSFLIWGTLECADGATYDLYNTKIATSDLRWTKEPRNSWEEVSGFDRHANVIRSYQICQLSSSEKNNWLRSPFINTRGAQKVSIEIEFSIAKCDWPGVDTDYCRQTFNLFYFESDRDVASSTFPPWQERPYIKVDTVAANSNDEINKKTFTIASLKNGGIYVAAQDQGACMSLISLRVYYYYCAETIRSLASFQRTMTGEEMASLVNVPGRCVRNAEAVGTTAPASYCGSRGEWQIITGSCKCMAGYYPDSAAKACLPCPVGTFKTDSGNGKCSKCPANSGVVGENAPRATASERPSACPCHAGFARAKYEHIIQACTKNPSAPIFVAAEANATSASISWKEPNDLGGRTDLYYSFSCMARVAGEEFVKCPETVAYQIRPGNHPEDTISLFSITKFHKNRIDIVNLEPFTRYVFKVYARNGVSDVLLPGDEALHLAAELTTTESVPSPVVNIYVADTSLNSVVINWQKPSYPGGRITGYEVEVRPRISTSSPSRAGETDAKERAVKPLLIETQKTVCALEDLESDTEYLVRIRAKTSVGFGRHSAAVMFKTAKRKDVDVGKSKGDGGNGFMIAAVCAVLALTVVCSLMVFFCSRRRARLSKLCKTKSASGGNPSTIGRYKEAAERARPASGQRGLRSAPAETPRTTYVDYPDPMRAVQRMDKEISPLFLRLHSTIGEGEFAVVYNATLLVGSEAKTVAAKQLREGASVKDRSNFLREACTMAQFDHPNILKLRGVVTKYKPEMIISEHMENGALHEFLKRHSGALTIPQLLHMLRGIGNGMKYLSEMQYVHRDLAARNILVDSDLVCKVSDFGLSRALENEPRATYTTRGGKIPFRWTAPECIRFHEFTPASDVWSFGIVMWEVMSYGEKPYWNMTNNEVGQSIGSGMRLPAPTGCPKALHQLMLECWSLDPSRRPTFAKIVSDLNKFIRHSSLLQARQEEEMERSVCCSPDARSDAIGRSAEPFLADPEAAGGGYAASDSSSLSQDDTCSSLVVTEERCLNV